MSIHLPMSTASRFASSDQSLAARLAHRALPWSPSTLAYYRDLVLVLVAKEFKVRYKSTFMGYAWSVMHPLAFALIFLVLFQVMLRFTLPAYALYLIAGLFPWQWISNATTSANFYFLGNSSLIKKVRFHRATLVLAGVLNEMVHFVVSIPVIVLFMLYYHRRPTLHWVWIVPILILVQLTMTYGLSLLIATSNLFFRDLERLTALVLHLTFYLTPIVFPPDRIPEGYRWALVANPFAPIVICWHGVFYDGVLPVFHLAMAAAWATIFLAAGSFVYAKCVWRFAEIV